MKRMTIIILSIAFLSLPVITHPQLPPNVGKNVEALLQQILTNQQQMQADIQRLKEALAQKDREIEILRELMKQQNQTLEQHSKTIGDHQSTVANSHDPYSARLQYETARDLMHEAIFDVRKGEQIPWFQRVVEEFRVVTDQYPQSPEAPEAQIRIARIFRRYLSDLEHAKKEYQKFLDQYPDNKYANEARKALQELQ